MIPYIIAYLAAGAIFYGLRLKEEDPPTHLELFCDMILWPFILLTAFGRGVKYIFTRRNEKT